MGLFGFGKKKEENANSCCSCSADATTLPVTECCGQEISGICCIKVLGAGCKACHEQYEHVQKAMTNLGLDIKTEYITDMAKVMEYGVMSMPAIVVNEKVVSFGKVLKAAEVENLLQKYGV